jgi:hypothetical protein
VSEPDTNTPSQILASSGIPFEAESFQQIGVTESWRKYNDALSWGRGQCLAVLDDGCDLTVAEWRVVMPWGPKVIATYNSIDRNDDPSPVPPGYHGTSVGFPSSLNYQDIRGVAFNNSVAHVRCISVVHLEKDETATMAAGLQWVIDHRAEYNITAVNLSPVDDQRHGAPVPTAIDQKLQSLRELDVWVSAPCGNHHYTDGISWPACQPHCFAIGATVPGKRAVHLDRWSNTDLLVAAGATSSSNACAAGCAQILREAIEKSGYTWRRKADNLPEAMMAIFSESGRRVEDEATGLIFAELDLLAAIDSVCSR